MIKRAKQNLWFHQNFDETMAALVGSQSFVADLNYYPYDSRYLKICDIEIFTKDERAIYAVEGYGQIELRKYGRIHTQIDSQPITLYLYCEIQDKNPTNLMAPFKDKTNSHTTYGGGRNLDVQIVDRKAVVDFNDATNMECAYSDKSVCALPLQENWLAVSIEAGEKIYMKR